MKYLKGSFLIATPGLTDPNFARSVVYMTEHNAEGAFGLIVTRPQSGIDLGDICEKIYDDGHTLPPPEILKRYAGFAGGPVQTSAVFFLHTQPLAEGVGAHDFGETGDAKIHPGTYLGNQAEELQQVLVHLEDHEPPRLRIFFGYSGWGPGQLEQELRSGGWLVKPAELDQIFTESPDQLWGELVRSFGGALGLLGNMPKNPELN